MSLSPISGSSGLQESFPMNALPEEKKKIVPRRLDFEEPNETSSGKEEDDSKPLVNTVSQLFSKSMLFQDDSSSEDESFFEPTSSASFWEDFEQRTPPRTPTLDDFDQHTPPSTPGSASSSETPQKVKKFAKILKQVDLCSDGQLMGSQAKAVEEVIELVSSPSKGEGLTDTPTKQQYSKAVRKTFREIELYAIGKENPVEFHTKGFEMISEQPLMKKLLNFLVRADLRTENKAEDLSPPKPIINIEHLIQPDKGKGFHIIGFNHPMYQLLTDKKVAPSGVFCAEFPVGDAGKMKCSTFFPSSTEEEIAQMLSDIFSKQKPLAAIANRSLYFSPNKEYVIEAYKEGPGLVKSSFPVFHFSQWVSEETKHEMIVGEPAISGKNLLDKAKQAVSEYASGKGPKDQQNPIRYTAQDGSLIIDLAPSLPELGIKQGIFIQFPRGCFLSIVDEETLSDLCPKS